MAPAVSGKRGEREEEPPPRGGGQEKKKAMEKMQESVEKSSKKRTAPGIRDSRERWRCMQVHTLQTIAEYIGEGGDSYES
jgi:hypothetical protein